MSPSTDRQTQVFRPEQRLQWLACCGLIVAVIALAAITMNLFANFERIAAPIVGMFAFSCVALGSIYLSLFIQRYRITVDDEAIVFNDIWGDYRFPFSEIQQLQWRHQPKIQIAIRAGSESTTINPDGFDADIYGRLALAIHSNVASERQVEWPEFEKSCFPSNEEKRKRTLKEVNSLWFTSGVWLFGGVALSVISVLVGGWREFFVFGIWNNIMIGVAYGVWAWKRGRRLRQTVSGASLAGQSLPRGL